MSHEFRRAKFVRVGSREALRAVPHGAQRQPQLHALTSPRDGSTPRIFALPRGARGDAEFPQLRGVDAVAKLRDEEFGGSADVHRLVLNLLRVLHNLEILRVLVLQHALDRSRRTPTEPGGGGGGGGGGKDDEGRGMLRRRRLRRRSRAASRGAETADGRFSRRTSRQSRGAKRLSVSFGEEAEERRGVVHERVVAQALEERLEPRDDSPREFALEVDGDGFGSLRRLGGGERGEDGARVELAESPAEPDEVGEASLDGEVGGVAGDELDAARRDVVAELRRAVHLEDEVRVPHARRTRGGVDVASNQVGAELGIAGGAAARTARERRARGGRDVRRRAKALVVRHDGPGAEMPVVVRARRFQSRRTGVGRGEARPPVRASPEEAAKRRVARGVRAARSPDARGVVRRARGRVARVAIVAGFSRRGVGAWRVCVLYSGRGPRLREIFQPSRRGTGFRARPWIPRLARLRRPRRRWTSASPCG